MVFAFGGDDVSAVVLDVGASTVKAGFAGDDSPRAVFPSAVGHIPSDTETTQRNYIGESQIYVYREHMEVKPVIHEGMIQDWDALEAIWDYTYKQRLNVGASEHPLLVSDQAWSSRDQREKLVELAFEKFHTPAFYIAKSAALSAFAAGRYTALVIDSGADCTSVVPVVEGFVLKKGIQKSKIAGNAISSYAKNMLENNQINIVPHYLIKGKLNIAAGQRPSPEVLLRRPATKSFHEFAVQRVLTEFKEAVFEISPFGFQQHLLASKPGKPFEFPDGYNNAFGMERFRLPEIVFTPNMSPDYSDGSVPGAQQLMVNSLNACDHEVRGTLASNMVICGGTSLIPNLPDRLVNGLAQSLGGFKPRAHVPQSSAERKYAAWIGGSVLGSLGNFHQMWISKAEFEEKGVSVEKRLP